MNSINLEEIIQTIDREYSILSQECKSDLVEVSKIFDVGQMFFYFTS